MRFLARRLTPFQDVHNSGPAEVNREGLKTGLLEYRLRFARMQKNTARNDGGTAGASDTGGTRLVQSLPRVGFPRQTAKRRLRILTQRYVLDRTSSGRQKHITDVQSGRQILQAEFSLLSRRRLAHQAPAG